MRRKNVIVMIALLIFGSGTSILHGQLNGGFVNLDFEAAILPAVPPGSFGSRVLDTVGIPGWISYFRLDHTIEHNSLSLGDQIVTIWGPASDPSRILNGSYSLELHIASFGSGNVGIGQTGEIPAGANWLLFNAHPQTALQVTFGGEPLTYSRVATREGYDIFAANIAAFSGQTAELRFNALATFGEPISFPGGIIDNIRFSAVPEPSNFALLSIGLVILVSARFSKRK